MKNLKYLEDFLMNEELNLKFWKKDSIEDILSELRNSRRNVNNYSDLFMTNRNLQIFKKFINEFENFVSNLKILYNISKKSNRSINDPYGEEDWNNLEDEIKNSIVGLKVISFNMEISSNDDIYRFYKKYISLIDEINLIIIEKGYNIDQVKVVDPSLWRFFFDE